MGWKEREQNYFLKTWELDPKRLPLQFPPSPSFSWQGVNLGPSQLRKCKRGKNREEWAVIISLFFISLTSSRSDHSKGFFSFENCPSHVKCWIIITCTDNNSQRGWPIWDAVLGLEIKTIFGAAFTKNNVQLALILHWVLTSDATEQHIISLIYQTC